MFIREMQGLTFDDVLLVPKRSGIASRSAVNTISRLTERISLAIPIISANMDTVTESEMAIAMARSGGIGIIHRFMSIEGQVAEVVRVKRKESFVVESPASISPHATVDDARAMMDRIAVGGLLVKDAAGNLEGIITNRDILFAPDGRTSVADTMTPRQKLITLTASGSPSVDLEAARVLLHNHRIEKLPLLAADGSLIGIITAKNIVKHSLYPLATKDGKGRLRVGAAVGVRAEDLKRAEACAAAGVDVIVLDIAHGHSEHAIKMTRELKRILPDVDLIAGNVATAEAVRDLVEAGADAIKVGVGAGSICVTRVVTGFGVPQLTAIIECAAAGRALGVPIIADGGLRTSGDITKAIAAGAATVMVGSLLAGTEESPGAPVVRDGQRYKIIRGMASLSANIERQAIDKGVVVEPADWEQIVPEGVEAVVPYRGEVSDILHQLVGGLRSGMSYAGATTITELQEKAEFIRITAAGVRESSSHDVERIG